MTRRCVLVVPDAGPFNSLWVAGRLDLLLSLDMPIVVVDAVYDEMTSDPENYPKDRDVKTLIDTHPETFIVELTDIGRLERERRANGLKPKRNAGDVAIADFMTDGLEQYASSGDPVLILFEDSDIPGVRFVRKPPNVHLLSTVGLLRGLERVGILESADAVIHAMLHPTEARHARVLTDLPAGTDEPATIGSTWTP
jgi:hypothetical protein